MNDPASHAPSPDVVAALRRGNVIEAIKRVREQHGIGLAEAEALVDGYRALLDGGDPAARTAAAPIELPLAAVVHLQRGRLIDAITVTRDHARCSLREASAAAHAYVEAHPHVHAMLREQQLRRRRHVFAIVAAIVSGAVALVAWTALR